MNLLKFIYVIITLATSIINLIAVNKKIKLMTIKEKSSNLRRPKQ